MLFTRILTALFLIPLVVYGMVWGSEPVWRYGTLIFALAAGYEWARLARLGVLAALAATAVLGGLALGSAMFIPQAVVLPPLFAITLIFWLLIVPVWLNRGWRVVSEAHVTPLRQALLLLAAAIVLLSTWYALMFWRWQIVGGRAGAQLLSAVMLLVWIADSAAYFSGRAFGRHKLAPTISPGKTWEGALGALLGVCAYTALVHHLGWLAPLHLSLLAALAWAALLTPVSIVGDLFESWLKRSVGVKDSGKLLPGHGGVFDRVDAILAVIPVGCAVYYFLKMA